jgi:hypothetical protein
LHDAIFDHVIGGQFVNLFAEGAKIVEMVEGNVGKIGHSPGFAKS